MGTMYGQALIERQVPTLHQEHKVRFSQMSLVALEDSTIEEKTLESFRGKVERVDGDMAHVMLVDSKEQEAYAECDAAELASQGIREGEEFTCTIKKRNGETVVTFAPIPRRRLSAEEWQQIRQETEEAIGDWDPRDDY